jgi:hypothetical protein
MLWHLLLLHRFSGWTGKISCSTTNLSVAQSPANQAFQWFAPDCSTGAWLASIDGVKGYSGRCSNGGHFNVTALPARAIGKGARLPEGIAVQHGTL